MLVLAGDIGGTNSRLALFRDGAAVLERTYPSGAYPSLEAVVEGFLAEARRDLDGGGAPQRACLAIAGPVENGTSRVTNLSWFVDERRVAEQTGISRVQVVNDFQAAAYGVSLLGPEHRHQIGGGPPQPRGPIAVAGAGTGLGQAFLVWSPAQSRYQVVPSEGGHVDFSARTALESGLYQYLARRHGRVSYERVLSGPGLRDLLGYLLEDPACRMLAAPETLAALPHEDGAALLVRQATQGRDALCTLALHLWASMLGGLAGNLALSVLATGGVYLAGGIAPRMVGFLEQGPLREAFESKGRFQPTLARIPMYVVLHRDVGLLGAAALAAES